MDSLVIKGPASLKGEVTISGSKNTVLPLLFAGLVFDEPFSFSNVPRLWDVETTLQLLKSMGTESQWNKEEGTLTLVPKITMPVAEYEWVKKMRAGILALGPLIAKTGEAKVSLPGGCAIGARPVNFHLDALKKMGAEIAVENGYIHAKAPKGLKAAVIDFPEVTVTGTENLMIAALFAKGTTHLKNAAQEPEVTHLAEFLKSCGAKIDGIGSGHLVIEGGAIQAPRSKVAVPPDRIETGTWIAIAVTTRSPLRLKSVNPGELTEVLDIYRKMGVGFETTSNEIQVIPSEVYKPVELETAPYPGFPTDMQAQLLVSCCFAQGTSRIREKIFENRFMHVAELRRMGAQIEIEGNCAVVKGGTSLQGAPIMATDLRASACLVVAALAAQGTTTISRIYHLDRGYQKLDQKLKRLGADITRLSGV